MTTFNDISQRILEGRYLLEGETPEQAMRRAADAYASNKDHADRLYSYAIKGWMMFASPVLSNAGNKKGLPISCYTTEMQDDLFDIMSTLTEMATMSSRSGGIGLYAGNLRSDGTMTSRGNESTGMLPFIKCADPLMVAFKQGRTRGGATAVYLDVSHPEIEEFVNARKPTGGDPRRKFLDLHHAVNIPDAFMEAVIAGTGWELIDPHTKQIKAVIPARKLWEEILAARIERGEPYLHFIDEANRKLHPKLQEKGLAINTSNLCSEIELVTNEERSGVCCLSSLNLYYWDEWKGTQIVEDMIEMLDNVISVFVRKVTNLTPEQLAEDRPHTLEDFRVLAYYSAGMSKKHEPLLKAAWSAYRERSLGLGTMGWHSLLMRKMIPFESALSVALTHSIFRDISSRAKAHSRHLATVRGEAPDLIGSGDRNANLLAIAPNSTSSLICGQVSPSIEPVAGHIVKQNTLSGTLYIKNPVLDKIIQERCEDPEAVWRDINRRKGSVQHVDWLTQDEKDVFKTAYEIDQNWVIEQAAARQNYICQAQSVNTFFRPDANNTIDKSYVSRVHINAWKKKLKTLYYCRTDTKAEDGEAFAMPVKKSSEDCLSCQG